MADSNFVKGDFNIHNFGNVSLRVAHRGGRGEVEINLDEGLLCSFAGTNDRTLRLSLAGGEAKDVGRALAEVAEYIQKSQFSA